MADPLNTPRFSGEIMTGAQAALATGAARHADVIDAEYETIAPARIDRPHVPIVRPVPDSRPSAAGLDTLRGEPAAGASSTRGRRAGAAFWTSGVAIAALAFWISGGHALFDLGAGSSAEPPAGLRISGVSSSVESAAARAMLLVDGEAVNDGQARRPLPPLSIAVTGLDGSVTRYRLGTSGRSLGEGERFAFSGRFEVPKEGVRTVSVTFVE